MEKNLGHATAYGYAKSKGYSGTEDEFARLMADYASVGQSAAESAEQAAASATSASGSAATASQAAQTATSKASEAVTAADTANIKASEASTSADTASSAATSASTSAQTATTASATATTKADEAAASETAALSAKTDAETARDAAAQSASRAEQSAESIDPDEFNRKIYAAFATDTATGSIASFPDGADSIPMKDVLVHIEPVQEGSGDPSPDNVRPITGWTGCVISHSGADMTNPTTYSITFPTEAGTVYGGTLDVTKGELVVDRAKKTLAKTDAYDITAGGARNRISCNFYEAGGKYNGTFVCNTCQTIANTTGGIGSADWQIWGSITAPRCWISVPLSIDSVDAFKDYVDANTIEIVYSLATPITYTLTPQEITSLLGVNNLWSDTGDSDVGYRADTKMYITKKITEAVSALT